MQSKRVALVSQEQPRHGVADTQKELEALTPSILAMAFTEELEGEGHLEHETRETARKPRKSWARR